MANGPAARPLSPHLTIYRPMLSMMMSIASDDWRRPLCRLVTTCVVAAGRHVRSQCLRGISIGRFQLYRSHRFFGHLGADPPHAGGLRHLIWGPGAASVLPNGSGWAAPICRPDRAGDHHGYRRIHGRITVTRIAP